MISQVILFKPKSVHMMSIRLDRDSLDGMYIVSLIDQSGDQMRTTLWSKLPAALKMAMAHMDPDTEYEIVK